ncbi:50S ribosomal protein L19e [Methermicoccus shengliensis]|uniref:Large ribosomal subunit protein eL19 n=1 Tax=Methermicoccus shengliensis TaxID=660064 RepID=A0A832RV49_9EURY|nr:50S ribosomal protein L19e [Methermicoccus shengliensis]KUK05101.1 MAG: 50S ribosomal protein L19e [Euryarchaeota archaeon 55_53]KUK30394.1 MAG: 50S ribosomal protein L19e [Methanosarcinales archeaon 56_1174]MDI3488417.1 large subunit ribosomal protein L19e [Methanosarcinales archaeon]MDN5294664.1 large subunit ribosomal protein L19e [Methanosarcinales archaeon]HIH69375.1 50S ribosomal protein L19e [Methermicoccus shengliensis]
MTDLRVQKRMAASLLGVGEGRVWIDPEEAEEVSKAITRQDVRELIEKGIIKRKPVQGISRVRARALAAKRAYGHRKGPGSRKGAKGARAPRKEQWIKRIRAQRRLLSELRDSGKLTRSEYRMLYRKSKGGEFRSTAHLRTYIETHIAERSE